MAWKADNNQTALSVAAYGVTTIDGVADAADIQAVAITTISSPSSAATSVGPANPLPVKQTSGKTIAYGVINTALAGENVLVASPGAVKIKVIGFVVVANAAVTIQIKSGTVAETGVTNLTGPMSVTANGGWQDRGHPDEYLFETASGKSFVLNLATAVQVSGYYSYVAE